MNTLTACVFLAALISMIGAAWLVRLRFNWNNGGLETRLRFTKGKLHTLFLFFSWKTLLIPIASVIAIGVASRFGLGRAIGTGFVVFGVNTLNWLWPATGAVTPTAAQVFNQDSVVVDCTTDGALTTQTFTHNLNISAADITAGWPDIIIEPNSPSGIPATLLLTITRPVTANAVIITFAAVVGTFRLKIKRPHSIGR